MKLRAHTLVALATLGTFAAGVVAPADASHGNAYGHGKLHCRAYHAHGEGIDNGLGSTTATIYRGNREVFVSTGTFQVGFVDSDGVASFTGTIVLTNDQGTLNAPVEGTLDTHTGEFMSTSDSVTGTGSYTMVTGRMRFAGVEDLQGLTFTETLQGKLCVPKKRSH
jgi:hypothetical protein